MTAPAALRPTGSPLRRLPALVAYVPRACLPRRRLAVLALPCATILASGLLSRAVDDRATEAFTDVAALGIFGLAMPLGTLVIGDAVLGAEVRSGTLSFTWLTPVRFWELAFARWLGGWLMALVTLVPSAAVAAVIAGAGSLIGPVVIATAAGAAAHIALFVFIGALTRRAAVWSLAIVFVVERLLGAALSGIAQLSPTWQGQAVFTGIGDVPGAPHRSGIPEGWDAVVRLGTITVVCLVLATFGLRRLQLTGARD
jgi:ABC-type transport system involved in multi-copper enzyme maturation permease subunit